MMNSTNNNNNNNNTTKEQGRTVARSTTTSNSRRRGGNSQRCRRSSSKPGACYGCGKVGHLIKDCPHPHKRRNESRPASSSASSSFPRGFGSRDTRTCYHCGDEGHLVRNCPNKRGNGSRGTASLTVSSSSSLESRDARNEGGDNCTSKRGSSGSDVSFTSPIKYIAPKEQEWSQGRETCPDPPARTLECGAAPARGGDLIFNEHGDCATLAFAWCCLGKAYGLSVRHLNEDEEYKRYTAQIGDEILMSWKDGVREIVATVVALGKQTDSMIFEFFGNIKIDPLAVAITRESIRHIKLDLDFDPLITTGMELVAFGGIRRGMRTEYKEMIKATNIGDLEYNMLHDARTVVGNKPLSDDGDCGMLYFNGIGQPVCMHRAMTWKKDANGQRHTFTCVATPLRRILQEHSRWFFGESAHIATNLKFQSSPGGPRLFVMKGIEAEPPVVPATDFTYGPECQKRSAENRGVICRMRPGNLRGKTIEFRHDDGTSTYCRWEDMEFGPEYQKARRAEEQSGVSRRLLFDSTNR